jgi:glycosyltransferase involved in cell wall biosynthesis
MPETRSDQASSGRSGRTVVSRSRDIDDSATTEVDDERLRVLAVCAVNGHGGPIQSLGTIVRELRERAIVTLASQRARLSPTLLDDQTVDLVEIPRPTGLKFAVAAWRLARYGRASRSEIDLIHANGLTEAALCLPMAIVSRRPVVVWIHNFERPGAFRLTEPLLRRRRSLTWIGVSVVAADQVPWADVELIQNPIAPAAPDAADTTRPTRPVIAYAAGTDRPYKGFDLLPDIIEATAQLDADWHVYTAPPYSSPDERCTAAWDRFLGPLAHRADIRARVADASSIYRSASVVVAPSRQESFNRVIVEALAHGVPVVASDIPAHRALAAECDAVHTFLTSDPSAAAAAIADLLGDRDAYRRHQSAARAFAARFEPDRIAQQILDAWCRAANRANR